MKRFILTILILSLLFPFLGAEETDDPIHIVEVRPLLQADGSWTFHVTLLHEDEGWHHYVDRWVVIEPATGTILGERILTHPHVHVQPFTRSLSGLIIPPGVTEVIVRASCTKGTSADRAILLGQSKQEN
ncbi:MAG: hypothetical protein PQJ60_05830 [Spirochaetales bacterium]|nr:hypothetical protein [Spirochaetales bacterium]